MTDEDMIELAINTIRTLSIDAVQQAKSGNSSLTLGGFFCCHLHRMTLVIGFATVG